jgi:putative sterol carrier protein
MPLAIEGLPSTASFDNVHLVLQNSENRAQVIKDTGAIATFVITNKDKSITASYTVDFKNEGTVKLGEHEGKEEDVDITLYLSDESFHDLATDKTSAKWLIFTGKLKTKGSILKGRTVEAALKWARGKHEEIIKNGGKVDASAPATTISATV